MIEEWNYIYNSFDPVAFSLLGFSVHWYGIMYVLALLSALFAAKWFVKRDRLPITSEELDGYFLWVEVGVILGARLGYILFYDPNTSYYLLNPWQMFNPFSNGEFVGISGMSYHGALLGFLIASFIYSLRSKISFWFLMDLVGLSVSLGYIFGRVGNFLNQELVGRATDMPWGIYVAGIKRHPSQLYEAFLEGVVVFFILLFYRKRAKFIGEIALLYGVLYGVARFSAEIYRAPDSHIGFICCDFLTMGQALSLAMVAISIALYPYVKSLSIPKRIL